MGLTHLGEDGAELDGEGEGEGEGWGSPISERMEPSLTAMGGGSCSSVTASRSQKKTSWGRAWVRVRVRVGLRLGVRVRLGLRLGVRVRVRVRVGVRIGVRVRPSQKESDELESDESLMESDGV